LLIKAILLLAISPALVIEGCTKLAAPISMLGATMLLVSLVVAWYSRQRRASHTEAHFDDEACREVAQAENGIATRSLYPNRLSFRVARNLHGGPLELQEVRWRQRRRSHCASRSGHGTDTCHRIHSYWHLPRVLASLKCPRFGRSHHNERL
jgi:hypothetical protein